jgi:small-conductance mechanosensitive channel
MADTRPTKINFIRTVRLCVLAVLAPDKLESEEMREKEDRATLGPPTPGRHPAHKVQLAFWQSLFAVVVSSAVGLLAAWVLNLWIGGVSSRYVSVFQILGAGALLWGTLFVRGWHIQTLSGVTLTERINQWIYRALYCVGTAILVLSVAVLVVEG